MKCTICGRTFKDDGSNICSKTSCKAIDEELSDGKGADEDE